MLVVVAIVVVAVVDVAVVVVAVVVVEVVIDCHFNILFVRLAVRYATQVHV